MQDLKGEKSISEICQENGLSQTICYKWRDAFLGRGKESLKSGNNAYDHVPEAEIEKLHKIIGEQAVGVEVQKNGLTVSEKIDAVKEFKEKGMSIRRLLDLFGISRGSYCGYIKDYLLKKPKTGCCLPEEELLKQIETIGSCYPFWRYKRVTLSIEYRLDIGINRKKAYTITEEHNQTVPQGKIRKTCTGSGRSKSRAEHPNEYWGIDMTKFMVESV